MDVRFIAIACLASAASLGALGGCNANMRVVANEPKPGGVVVDQSVAQQEAAPFRVYDPPRIPPEYEIVLADSAIQGGVLLGRLTHLGAMLTIDGEPVKVTEDGHFILGFNRDAAAKAEVKAVFPNGTIETKTITVKPRQWNIENVDLPRRETTSSASFQRRRAPELAAIGSARAFESDAQGWRQDFAWPTTGRISGMFGSQRVYRGDPGGYHTGIDIAAAPGTPVIAPADGVVTLAASKPFSLEGNLLMLDHGMGLNSAFLHLSKIAVKEGDVVRKGQYIGNVGATGSATGPHLHWSMKWRAARLDPILLTGPMP